MVLLKTKSQVKRYLLSSVLLFLVAACGPSVVVNHDSTNSSDATEAGYGLSDNNSVKMKRHQVLQNDLAAGLELPKDEICTELDGLNCMDEVHKIILGGSSAYIDTIYEPMEKPIAPTVVAIERVVTNACSIRVEKDFSGLGAAAIFAEIVNGDVTTEAIEDSVKKLFQKAYLRNPKSSELNQFNELYSSIKDQQIPDAAKSFALASCFSVFTSLEFLFY